MKLLADFKQSLIWHVVTGKYEVTDKGELRKRKENELNKQGVPKGWKHYRFKDKCKYIMGQNITKDKTNTEGKGIQFLRTNDVFEDSTISKEPLHYDGETSGLVIKTKDDLLICTEGFNTEVGKGTLGLCTKNFEGIISDHLRIVKINAKDEERVWIEYCHQTTETANHLVRGARGSIAYRASHIIPEIKFWIPSDKKELSNAVKFLSSLDTLIPSTDGVLKLINDWYQSTVWHVVTGKYEVTEKGELRKRKDSELKDSGVEWIGKIPKGWDVWKLSRAFSTIGSGTTPPSSEPEWYEGGTIPWVTTGELRESVITDTEKKVTSQALQKYPALRVHPKGSVAIAMYGATIGRLAMFGVDATTNQACCVLSGGDPTKSVFAMYCLGAFKEVIIGLFAVGGGQPNINQETIRRLRIPTPPENESKKILSFLESLSKKVEKLKENL